MIEGEHFLFGERSYELNGEERIAARLLLHQLRERRAAFPLAAKRVCKQLLEMLPGERRKRNLPYLSAGTPDRVELAHQRMGNTDFVVAIGPDQHQMLWVRPRQQILQQVERRRVEPLQIVEKQGQWMLLPREYADKTAEHQLKAALSIPWWNFRNRRLVSDNEL